MGHGEGVGQGGGGDQTTGILAGSVVACCFLVFMWVIGIPLFIAGIVMVQISDGDYGGFDDDDDWPFEHNVNPLRTPGIVCIVIAVIMVIIGIILIVLTCCLGSRRTQGRVVNGGTTTVVSHTVVQGAPGQQSYPGQPSGQPYGGQPYGGQPYGGQPYGGQPYGGQPYPGQPYGGQPYPGQPYYDPNAQPPPYQPPPSGPPPKS